LYSLFYFHSKQKTMSATIANEVTDREPQFEESPESNVQFHDNNARNLGNQRQYDGYVTEGHLMTRKEILQAMSSSNMNRKLRRNITRTSQVSVTGMPNRVIDDRTAKARRRLQKKLEARKTNK